jgi:magnesium-transporting ATPase (P-type)
VLEKKGDVLALVVNIGYASRRGRIIRKILARSVKTPDSFWKAIQFLAECFLVAAIIYFATLPFTLSRNISDLFVGFRFIDFLGWSFPTALPIYFNSVFSLSMRRLLTKDIMGTEPDRAL